MMAGLVNQIKLGKTLKVINDMQAAGVIGRYAIGGAVGAIFYLEPVRTVDVDVFVAIHQQAGSIILTPKPIYDYLTARGYLASGEYLLIESWPVQFLPPTSALVEEAIVQAREADVEGEPTFVISAEHLVAIALETGRAKDKARIIQFVEANVLNRELLLDIFNRHNLSERWTRFEQKFFNEKI
jgi:hypothetical protein